MRGARFTYDSDELHRRVSVAVIPPNKIDPAIALTSVTGDASTGFTYTYRLSNGTRPGSTQGLMEVQFPCPAAASVAAPVNWTANLNKPSPRRGRPQSCEFLVDTVSSVIAPGLGIDGFIVRSNWLPAFGDVHAWGYAPPPVYPREEDEHVDLYPLIDTVIGVEGGWLTRRGVAPVRDPATLTAASTIDTMRGDLATSCRALQLVTDANVCHRLDAMLEQAAQSIAGKRAEAARGLTKSFLGELEAQHGPEPGKHVTDTGYWLLRTNATYVLGLL